MEKKREVAFGVTATGDRSATEIWKESGSCRWDGGILKISLMQHADRDAQAEGILPETTAYLIDWRTAKGPNGTPVSTS